MNNSFTKFTTDERGIPIVQPSPRASSSSRSKSRSVAHEASTDEIQLCKVPSSSSNRDVAPQRTQLEYFARVYQHSPTRASSPRIHSDSWQDASTEPMTPYNNTGDKNAATPNEPETPNSSLMISPKRRSIATSRIDRLFNSSPNPIEAPSSRTPKMMLSAVKPKVTTANMDIARNDPVNDDHSKEKAQELVHPNTQTRLSNSQGVPDSSLTITKAGISSTQLPVATTQPPKSGTASPPVVTQSTSPATIIRQQQPTSSSTKRKIIDDWNDDELSAPAPKVQRRKLKEKEPEHTEKTVAVAEPSIRYEPSAATNQLSKTNAMSPPPRPPSPLVATQPTKRRIVDDWNDELPAPKVPRRKSKEKEPERTEKRVSVVELSTQYEPSAGTSQLPKTNTMSPVLPCIATQSTKRRIVDDWNGELPAPKAPCTKLKEKEPEQKQVAQDEPQVDNLSVKEPKAQDKSTKEEEDQHDDNKKPTDTTTNTTTTATKTMGPPTNKKKPATKEEEAAKVAEEIAHLMKTVKCLPNYYKLLDKIGEGTFSTVYKALDIRRNFYQNDDWEPQLLTPPTSSDDEQTATASNKTLNEYVALKRIYDTSSPRRIANEINILRKLKGSQCISPLITAFRQQDQVFVVMPYIQHDDFKEIFATMSMDEIKHYLRSMFTALQHLHKFGILHRDVKPNNFLYNRKKKTGYLIDFGLAESESDCKALELYAAKLEKKVQNNHLYITSKHVAQAQMTSSSSVLATLGNKENRASTSAATAVANNASAEESALYTGHRVMGYIKNDARHSVRANRAGTRGFRAPEILMRVTRQTCAIDIWAVGVIMLCFMTSRYPFFLANDEADSIIELAQIYGYQEMKKCAKKYKRIFSTNISIPQYKISYAKICEYLNKKRIDTWDKTDYRNGLDLLEKCLDLDSSTRITAAQALEHPFFNFGDGSTHSV